jgi:hypothetical protein
MEGDGDDCTLIFACLGVTALTGPNGNVADLFMAALGERLGVCGPESTDVPVKFTKVTIIIYQ